MVYYLFYYLTISETENIMVTRSFNSMQELRDFANYQLPFNKADLSQVDKEGYI